MNRTDLLTYIKGALAGPLGQVARKMQATDQPEGLKYVLDDVFRALGVAEASLGSADVDASLTADAQALARYLAFSAILDQLAAEQDTQATQVKASRTQPFSQSDARLRQYKQEVITRGYGRQLGLVRTTKLRAMGTV